MQANVVTLNRTQARSQGSEGLSLPESPEALIAAELRLTELTAALVVAKADLETLSANFNMLGNLRRADGSLFPDSGREGVLAALMGQCADLEAAKEKARRGFDDARRAFSEQVSRDLRPAADAVSERALHHIEEAMRLVDMLSDIATEARKSGLTVQHAQVERAAGLARQLHSIRAQIAPTPKMGVR